MRLHRHHSCITLENKPPLLLLDIAVTFEATDYFERLCLKEGEMTERKLFYCLKP